MSGKEKDNYYNLREKMNNTLNTISKELEFYYTQKNDSTAPNIDCYLTELVKKQFNFQIKYYIKKIKSFSINITIRIILNIKL